MAKGCVAVHLQRLDPGAINSNPLLDVVNHTKVLNNGLLMKACDRDTVLYSLTG